MCKSIYSCFLEIKFEVIITLLIIWSQNLKLNFFAWRQLHLKLNSQITTKLMGDDEDWDPIRVKALKRRLSRRKSDRKRRKTQSGRERHARTNSDEASSPRHRWSEEGSSQSTGKKGQAAKSRENGSTCSDDASSQAA